MRQVSHVVWGPLVEFLVKEIGAQNLLTIYTEAAKVIHNHDYFSSIDKQVSVLFIT